MLYGVLIVRGVLLMTSKSFYTDESIKEVLDIYSNTVFRLALTRTGNKADAEDVFQEVFLRYIKQKKQFENEEHRKAWLIKVTLNCSHKLFSSAWFRHTVPLITDLSYETQEKSEIYFTILSLPKKYRSIIHLFYFEDLSISQISKILSIKESTVKTQLHRARQMLKLQLKGDYDYE
jgi:RNA polymerase sigma-70 factor (ECF subfamily)